jgi:hypothetical protein
VNWAEEGKTFLIILMTRHHLKGEGRDSALDPKERQPNPT